LDDFYENCYVNFSYIGIFEAVLRFHFQNFGTHFFIYCISSWLILSFRCQRKDWFVEYYNALKNEICFFFFACMSGTSAQQTSTLFESSIDYWSVVLDHNLILIFTSASPSPQDPLQQKRGTRFWVPLGSISLGGVGQETFAINSKIDTLIDFDIQYTCCQKRYIV
jgi:hypothetical protein